MWKKQSKKDNDFESSVSAGFKIILPLLNKFVSTFANPTMRQLIVSVFGLNIFYEFSALTHTLMFIACIGLGTFIDSAITARRFNPENVKPNSIGLTNSQKSQLHCIHKNIKSTKYHDMFTLISLQMCSDFLTVYQLGFYFIIPHMSHLSPAVCYPLLAVMTVLLLFMSHDSRKENLDARYNEYDTFYSHFDFTSELETAHPTHKTNIVGTVCNYIFLAVFVLTQTCYLHAINMGFKNWMSTVVQNLISPYSVGAALILFGIAWYFDLHKDFLAGALSIISGQGMVSTLSFIARTHLTELLAHLRLSPLIAPLNNCVQACSILIGYKYSFTNFCFRTRHNKIERIINLHTQTATKSGSV